ncbi:hypothetical protein [Microbacterium pumilum]|uniref:Uncharacterized protein n=1 Tax=Microbacterium pumilum TaxID=344165 RepID=A0ABN2S282_9MICO
MIDRADAEAVIYRVAVSAFAYYPDKATKEPGYTVDEDVEWSLEPVSALDSAQTAELEDRIREAITSLACDRQGFIQYVLGLADA